MSEMAIIRMLKTAAGPEGVFPAGALAGMETAAAALLVAAGAAEWVVEVEAQAQGEETEAAAAPAEAAVVESPERAVAARPRAKRRGGM